VSKGVEPTVQFLPFAGRRMAYEVRGEGPALVVPPWWMGAIQWREPAVDAFWADLAAGLTLVRYDRLGVGLSDRDVSRDDLSLDADVDALRALVDHLGLERFMLAGGSSGGCTAIAFAARFPERVGRLLLIGTYAHGQAVATPDVQETFVSLVRSHWGLGARLLADIFVPGADAATRDRFARFQRESADAETAATLLEFVYTVDVRAEVPRVQAPVAVLHRRRDRVIRYELGRELAAALPHGTLVPLDGVEHFPWRGDTASMVRASRTFLVGEERPSTGPADHDHELSAREVEVLALVARGLSDREIAEQLVVSHHTVHRHVANIRQKLGQGSRAAAVAEAARLGLL
jgi:pimeloyl-ACP methyl ester carboxylesterase/DNA-binding CsgD family transcriptional regulator